MELLQGITLAGQLQQQGAMTCDHALPLIGQMVSALSAAPLPSTYDPTIAPALLMP
jgi:hypothetical protein